jgi:hypothetical protein
MGRRGPKPRRATNPVWTPELAYACGLLATDGCLYNDGRHINLTSKDTEQLETFKRCLGLTNKIGSKSSSFSHSQYYQIQFGDVGLYQWLISIGITPQKTKTIGLVKVPDRYFFDFLRGEFDGDGSSHAYWDTRWRSSVSFYLGFVSASYAHLAWLQRTIQDLAGVTGVLGQYGAAIPSLKFSKTTARIICE